MKNNDHILLIGITVLFIGLMIGIYIGNAASKNYIQLTSDPASSIIDSDYDRLTPEIVKLDINTATVEELTILPGIGEHTAKQIVEYRERFGPYRSINDLINVNGIGQGRIDQIAKYITAEG